MEPAVDIAFDCLPLRSVGRVDVPLDASPSFRTRCEHLQQAIAAHAGQNAYFLYNTRCIFRLANSDVENMLRFSCDGVVVTDLGDGQAERADLRIELAANTCDSMTPEALLWFAGAVERAILIEFNRFIAAGKLADRVAAVGQVASVADLNDFAGMNV